MPMTKSFETVEGRIVAEVRSGVRTDFLCDAEGSFVVAADEQGQIVAEALYLPYGTPGGATDLGWLRGNGYQATGLPHAEQVVGDRSYSAMEGRWSTLPHVGSTGYSYAAGDPVNNFDPTGVSANRVGPLPVGVWDPIPGLPFGNPRLPPSPRDKCRPPGNRPDGKICCSPAWNTYIWRFCNWCYCRYVWYGDGGDLLGLMDCTSQCDYLASQYYDSCARRGRKPRRRHSGFRPPFGGGEVAPMDTLRGPCCVGPIDGGNSGRGVGSFSDCARLGEELQNCASKPWPNSRWHSGANAWERAVGGYAAAYDACMDCCDFFFDSADLNHECRAECWNHMMEGSHHYHEHEPHIEVDTELRVVEGTSEGVCP